MSTDPLALSEMPDDPTNAAEVRGDTPQSITVAHSDLIDIVAAIERAAQSIAAGTAASGDFSAAVERVADIAFVLHERDVERSLCDTLDAAVREIGQAAASNLAAAESLRALAQRVNDMMAQAQATRREELLATQPAPVSSEAPVEPPVENEAAAAAEDTNDEELPSPERLLDEVREDDAFAQAVAALVASLPPDADTVATLAEPQTAQVLTPAWDAEVRAAADDGSIPTGETGVSVGEAKSAADESDSPASALPAEVTPSPESSADVVVGEQALAIVTVEEATVFEVPAEHAASATTENQDSALASDAPSPAVAAPPESVAEGGIPNGQIADMAGAEPGAQPSEVVNAVSPPSVDPVAVAPEPSMPSSDRSDDLPAAYRPTEAGEDGGVPAAESSRALLPDPFGPEEDPGDLFEPIGDETLVPPVEQAAVTVEPAEPGDGAARSEQAGNADAVREPAGATEGQAAADAREESTAEPPAVAGGLAAASTSVAAAAVPPASTPPAQPPVPQASRAADDAVSPSTAAPAPNDPLAVIRALSEEELIALFS